MRKLLAGLLAFVFIPGIALANGRVESKNTEENTQITFTFDDAVATGEFSGRATGCATFRAIFDQATTGQVAVHAVPRRGDPTGPNTLINVFAADTPEPGDVYNSVGAEFVFDVTIAETASESVLVLRCSNAQVS